MLKPNLVIKQSGVIPYRFVEGKLEVLLITTSRRKRWIFPKGLVEFWMTPEASAAKEAYEEAGVKGTVTDPAIGSYEYRKWGCICRVEVFPMQVEQVLEDWQEAHTRLRQWVSISGAIKRLEIVELQHMVEKLRWAQPGLRPSLLQNLE